MSVCSYSLSHVQLFATPWLQPSRLLCPWDSPGKNTGVGGHFPLRGIFPNQGSNPHLQRPLHWQADALALHHLGTHMRCSQTGLNKPLPLPPGVHRLWEKQVCNRLLQYGIETFMTEVSERCKVYIEDLGWGLGQFGKSVEWQPKLQRGPVAARIILGSIVSSPDSRPPGTSCCDLTWR